MTESTAADSVGKVAVIGMAGRYPKAWTIKQFWQNLKEEKECVHFFSDDELLTAGVSSEMFSRPDYVKAAGVCPGAFLLDASFFGYTPREAEFLDPQHRVFLECAWEALENAGYDSWTYPGRIGLFAGSGATQYLFELLTNPEVRNLADPLTLFTSGDKDFLAARAGYKLNLRGPCISIQTGCSTSLVSIVMACQSLLHYQSDIALGGGVSLGPTEGEGYIYQEGSIHSPDGHSRAFDADGRGFCPGTGAGVVVLRRLEDALAEGDTIHAVILGSAITNDGATRAGFAAPGVNGQVAVISDAIAMAGINPETIGLVECHGTATLIGDPIEITALTRAFRAYTQEKNFCAVGSVKTNIGHTDAAAGVAGFIKAVLALENRLIPASLHFHQPNPNIDFANSPFYVNTRLQPWTHKGAPRRAAVSSFGLGGTNAHVILEESPGSVAPSAAAPWNLLVWSARTASALKKMSANLLDHLKTHSEDSLADVAYTLQVGRRLLPYRQALVCRDHEDAIAALASAEPGRLLFGHCEKEAGPVALVFPGSGCQYIDMGKDVASVLNTVAQLWLEGQPIDWRAFHHGQQRHRIPLPTYPFERQHYQINRRHVQAFAQMDGLHDAGAATRPDSLDDPYSGDVMGAVYPRPDLPVPYVAPCNELERAIARIWGDIFGIVAVGVNDSFMALGGHSLLAVQLVARIRAIFKIQITLADLYAASTIAGLAASIACQITEKSATGPGAQTNAASAARSALVPIRSSGQGVPLFLLHAAGGGIAAYHDLAKHLRPEHPVYAIQNLDSGNDVQQPRSIQDMASRYIEAIRIVSPGPYLLSGASMGGALAFEMAVQLTAQGREVLLVAVLDTPARIRPRTELHDDHSALAVELIMFASNVVAGRQTDLQLDFADLDPLQPEEQIELVFHRLRQQQLLPASLSSSEFQTALRTMANNMSAFERYTPPNYKGKVAILRAQEITPDIKRFAGELSDDPTFGWQAHCIQPVTVRFVPGDHGSMIREPNVRVTATELQQLLDEAEGARLYGCARRLEATDLA